MFYRISSVCTITIAMCLDPSSRDLIRLPKERGWDRALSGGPNRAGATGAEWSGANLWPTGFFRCRIGGWWGQSDASVGAAASLSLSGRRFFTQRRSRSASAPAQQLYLIVAVPHVPARAAVPVQRLHSRDFLWRCPAAPTPACPSSAARPPPGSGPPQRRNIRLGHSQHARHPRLPYPSSDSQIT